MSSTPISRSITVAAHTLAAPAKRRRLAALLVALAVAVAVLATPRFASAAGADPFSAHHQQRTAQTARNYAKAMLHLLNKERTAHHLRKLTMNSKLILSAHRHNLAMAKANEMSHQVKGEKFFADRISAAHYKWLSAGENIGWNSEQTQSGLNYLEREMYHEKAPDNGHRLNILDKHFRNVGIDVYFDKKHDKMWFTQDFGQPA
jgi:uncharacterized protein YkwD